MIAIELVNAEYAETEARVTSLLEGHDVEGYLQAENAIEVATCFRDHLSKTFAAKSIWIEWPVSHRVETGQLARGWVDVLMETESRFVVIDHKT